MWYIILLTWLNAVGAHTWVNSGYTWYYVSSDSKSYHHASLHCTDLNGYLTNLEGDPCSAPFASKLQTQVPYLIGARYNENSQKYIWPENKHEVDAWYVEKISGGEGSCVLYSYDEDSAELWKLKTSDCIDEYRYICKSHNQRCNTINVRGFRYKSYFNGEYNIVSNNMRYTVCLTRYPIYVHTSYNATVYVCKTIDDSRFYFYKQRRYEGYIYSTKTKPHLVNSDSQAQEIEKKYDPPWFGVNIQITCIEYTDQVTIPITTLPASSPPKSTTTTTQATTRITRQSSQRTQTSQPTHIPISPQTSHPANSPTLMQTSPPSNMPLASSTSETESNTDNRMPTILLYMNIAIWTLVGIFLCVDAFLFVWFMRLRKQK